uniref:Arv1-like family protein n=1 Tax=Myoviridae sp. ctbEa13 TaxID=2825136 RepID=A0A8S5VBQ0_9CAUD|nr:MAG TPA: Arv1-like family protein [Myoviridae sp. ctbEa13]
MAKYIDFNIAVRKLGTWYNDLVGIYGSDEDFVKGYGDAMDDLADVPAADVQEVKHSRWEYYNDTARCVNCDHYTKDAYFDDHDEIVLPKYCSNCGAKMDLEDEK